MKIFFITIIAFALYCWGTLEPSFAYDAYDDNNQSPEEIAKLLAQAQKGDAEAQFNLAEAYLRGEGVVQNEKEAARWYYKAAVQGYVDAQIAMGFVYRGGGGLPMDKVLSYMWLDLAAKSGDDRAVWLRNELAWSMTNYEIEEAREKSLLWKPETRQKHYGSLE